MYILLEGRDAVCFWNPVLWCFGIVHRLRTITGESREAIGGFLNKEMVKSGMYLEIALWKMEWRREGYVEGCGSVFSTIVLTGGQEGVTKSREVEGRGWMKEVLFSSSCNWSPRHQHPVFHWTLAGCLLYVRHCSQWSLKSHVFANMLESPWYTV